MHVGILVLYIDIHDMHIGTLDMHIIIDMYVGTLDMHIILDMLVGILDMHAYKHT